MLQQRDRHFIALNQVVVVINYCLLAVKSMASKKNNNEARAAMTELISELDRTRKEYAKATLQLTQNETALQHLKDAELKKDQVIAHLEAEAERKEEVHRQEIEVLNEEFRTKDAAWSHRVKHLELEVQRLQQENEAAALFEKENRTLRDTVMEHQATIERLQLINDDLRSRAKEDNHEHAAELEAEFKRRLADAEKKFRAEAYRALSEEAKVALQGNDHLQTVLQRQNDSIEAVLLRCKQLEQAHTRISQEQEMSQQNLNHHMTEIQRLKKQLGDARSKNAQLEESLKQRKVERASLELLFVEYETTRKQLTKVQEKSRRAMREAERWRNRAVQLTHELGEDQREAAEAKLQQIQMQSDRIESHIAKRQVRSARRARDRQAIQEGAAALRMTEEGDDVYDQASDDNWSDISDVDDGAEEAGRKAKSMNPMDILAMWNVNFDGMRTSPGQDGGATAAVESKPQDPQESQVEITRDPGSPIKEAPSQLAPTHFGSHSIETVQDAVAGKRALAPVRPPARVSEARQQMDAHLSVLARPKQQATSAPARHFGVSTTKPPVPVGKKGGNISLAPELSVVSHGQFKTAKLRRGGDSDRFLVPS